MSLDGKVALVTGGARGIGRAVVEALLADGAKVAFTFYQSKSLAEETQASHAQKNGDLFSLACDVRDAGAVEKGVDDVLQRYGRLDILVNNAGIIRDGLFLTLETDAWEEVLTVNLGGAFRFSRAVLPHMVEQRHGRVINITSVVSELGGVGQANYIASKGALNAFTRALASEFASKGITVNAVAPGMIKTDMSQAVRSLVGTDLVKRIPVGRFGEAEEVASVVRFLASDEAGYITGQVLTIDGGMSLQGRR